MMLNGEAMGSGASTGARFLFYAGCCRLANAAVHQPIALWTGVARARRSPSPEGQAKASASPHYTRIALEFNYRPSRAAILSLKDVCGESTSHRNLGPP